MITGKGVGFLIAAVAVFFLGRLTQVGWLYLMDAVLWGIVLLSAILPWVNVPLLEARRRIDHPGAPEGRTGPAEGESVDITIDLRNRARWPRFFLSASYHCPMAGPEERWPRFFLGKLPGLGRSSLTSTVVAYQRGEYSLGQVMVEASAPFGLFRRRVRLGQAQDVLVYPRIYPLRSLSLVDGLAGAAMQRRKSRVGLETAGSRPYFPGDPRRYIHWRNTARAGRPMVREFEDPRDQALCLLFDASRVWGQDRDTTLEYAIAVVASVADYARRQQVPTRLWGGSLRGETTGGAPAGGPETGAQTPWAEVLRRLAVVMPGEGPPLAQSLDRAPAGASAIAVVAEDDIQGVRSIRLAAPKLHRLTVVALVGFSGAGPDSPALEPLDAHRVPLVRCRPGRLAEALQALESPGVPGPREALVV